MRAVESAFFYAVALAIGVAGAVWLLVIFEVELETAIGAAIIGGLLGAACAVFAVALSGRSSVLASRDTHGARFAIRKDGLGRFVELVASEVPGADNIEPTVKCGGGRLGIVCTARLQPRFNPIDVRRRLRSHLRERIPDMTGLSVSHVSVRFEGLPVAETDEYF